MSNWLTKQELAVLKAEAQLEVLNELHAEITKRHTDCGENLTTIANAQLGLNNVAVRVLQNYYKSKQDTLGYVLEVLRLQIREKQQKVLDN